MFTRKIIIIMSIAIGVLLIFIAGLLLWKSFYVPGAVKNAPGQINNNPVNNNPEATPKSSLEAAKVETKKVIDEAMNDAKNNPNSISKVVKIGTTTAVVVAPGTSPVSAATGEVLTKDGAPAQNNPGQGRLNAVTDSLPLDPSRLPASTIKLTVSARSITPKEFTVHPGQAVSLALINAAPWSEVIIFADPSLSSVIFTFPPNTTKAITFNAPARLGEYLFYSNVPEERALGLEGKMIVK